MRRAKSGKELVSPRECSIKVFPDVNRPSVINTLMLMLYGQFLDHDLDRSAITKQSSSEDGTCCSIKTLQIQLDKL